MLRVHRRLGGGPSVETLYVQGDDPRVRDFYLFIHGHRAPTLGLVPFDSIVSESRALLAIKDQSGLDNIVQKNAITSFVLPTEDTQIRPERARTDLFWVPAVFQDLERLATRYDRCPIQLSPSGQSSFSSYAS